MYILCIVSVYSGSDVRNTTMRQYKCTDRQIYSEWGFPQMIPSAGNQESSFNEVQLRFQSFYISWKTILITHEQFIKFIILYDNPGHRTQIEHNLMFQTSSKRLMYVQFTSCIQGVESKKLLNHTVNSSNPLTL